MLHKMQDSHSSPLHPLQILAKMESENENLTSITIDDDDGVYKYLFNMPEQIEIVDQVNPLQYRIDTDCQLYVVPRDGDILLDVEISGTFESCIMFQYDSNGWKRQVYDTLTKAGTMTPFPHSGIPLIQCGKAIYIEIFKSTSEITVYAKYAFLNTTCRLKLAQYTHPDDKPLYNYNGKLTYRNGTKITHANTDVYQVYNVGDQGFSPNYLGKCN